MRSLTTAEQDEALRYIYLAVTLRGEGNSEGTIAEELRFPSVPRMYQRMEELQCPHWTIFPEPPKSKQQSIPQARRGGGKTTNLPPAANADDMFRDAVARLEEDRLRVKGERLALQDGKFYTTADVDESHIEYRGGSWAPESEIRLIAARLMDAAHPAAVQRLVEKLHPEPSEAPWEQIWEHLYGRPEKKKGGGVRMVRDGLRPRAYQLARLIRGGEIKPGRKARSVSALEHVVASHIRHLQETGLSWNETMKTIKEVYGIDDKGEISRLAKISPPKPPED